MNKKYKQRVPVLYRNKPYSPIRWGRAKKLIKRNKAVFKYHGKLGIKYLKMLVKPSGEGQELLVLGIDPGTHFDGFSILSKYCHHENFELIHNKNIKKKLDKKRSFRRTRRCRLRQRKCRNYQQDFKRLLPSIRSILEFKKWLISQIQQLYHISKIIIEDVAYNHFNDTKDKKFKKGKYFSLVEIGKKKLYEYLESLVGIENFRKTKGFITVNVRKSLFPERDPKISDKGKKCFWAHGVDSMAIASMCFDKKYRKSLVEKGLNLKLRIFKKIPFNRRELYRTRKKRGDSKYLFTWGKGGVKKYHKEVFGKKNVCRVQKYENSWREFEYVKKPKDLRYKYTQPQRYGGTVWYGIPKQAQYRDIRTNELVKSGDFQRDHLFCKWCSKNKEFLELIGYKNRTTEVIRS